MMILEDEYWARESIRRLCGMIPEVYVVAIFEEGMQAIDFACKVHIDVAIIDVCLPNHSGFEIGKTLKLKMPELNLIYISAVDAYETEIQKYGGDSFLSKPVTLKALQYALRGRIQT